MSPPELTDLIQREIIDNDGIFTWRGVTYRVVQGLDLIKQTRQQRFNKGEQPSAHFVRGLQQHKGRDTVISSTYVFKSSRDNWIDSYKAGYYTGWLTKGICNVTGVSSAGKVIVIEHVPELGNPVPQISEKERQTAMAILGLGNSELPSGIELMNITSKFISEEADKACKSDLNEEQLNIEVAKNTENYQIAYEVLTFEHMFENNTQLQAREDQAQDEIRSLKERLIAQGAKPVELEGMNPDELSRKRVTLKKDRIPLSIPSDSQASGTEFQQPQLKKVIPVDRSNPEEPHSAISLQLQKKFEERKIKNKPLGSDEKSEIDRRLQEKKHTGKSLQSEGETELQKKLKERIDKEPK